MSTNEQADKGKASGSAWSRFRGSRLGRGSAFVLRYRKSFLFGASVLYFTQQYLALRAHQLKRDVIRDNTYLYWKFYDGGIVEHRTSGSAVTRLLTSSQGSPEEPPRVMTLFEVIRSLNWIQADDRIKGIIADFSSTSVPQVAPYSLGLAQIEEICDAIAQVRETKKNTPGCEGFRTIAFADTFHNQVDYCLASAFGEVYAQKTGEVPLTGLSATIPFYNRIIEWFGIKVQSQARNEYKSVVAPYTSTELSEPQAANERELLGSLHENFCRLIARNRFPDLDPDDALEKVKGLAMKGPYSASEAVENGLLDGATYKRHLLDPIFLPSKDKDQEQEQEQDKDKVKGDEHKKDRSITHHHKKDHQKMNYDLKGFYHYWKQMSKVIEATGQPVLDIGVVYLMGTIGQTEGDFSTASVIRGLKEAAEDDSIGAIVLRIDTGGGGVVESDSIHDAVQACREKGKVVVSSFGNAAASGGYLVATHSDAILAQPSTITGSIGVAAMRPVITQTALDRLKLTVQHFFTGSNYSSTFTELEGEQLEKYKKHVDEMYDDFKSRVVDGRGIHKDLIEHLAGGRVMTGWQAFGLIAPPELMRKLARREEADVVIESTPPEAIAEAPIPTGISAALQSVSEDADNASSTGEGENQVSKVSEQIASDSTSKDADKSGQLGDNDKKSDTDGKNKDDQDDTKAEAIIIKEDNGPMGKGLIDSLGGIRDAASLACEMWIQKAYLEIQQEHPDWNRKQILAELLPDLDIDTGGDENFVLSVDLNLKKFPEEKGFLRTLREAQLRGDSIEPNYIVKLGFESAKMFLATTLIDVGHRMISDQLDSSGVGANNMADVRSALGLGPVNRRRNWVNANLPNVKF